MLLQMALSYSFPWLSSVPLYICTISFLSIQEDDLWMLTHSLEGKQSYRKTVVLEQETFLGLPPRMGERVCPGTEEQLANGAAGALSRIHWWKKCQVPRRKVGALQWFPQDYPQRDPWPLTQVTVLANMYTADQKCHQTRIPQPAPCYRVPYQWPPYHHTTHLMVVFLGPECKMRISMIS